MNELSATGEPVSIEILHEVEMLLRKEARLLDNEELRVWLDTIVDPEIRYQMVISEERFRNDRSEKRLKEVMPYDETYAELDLRVRQFESGLQHMGNPAQRMMRCISNVEAFLGGPNGELRVRSYCVVHRTRRLYENYMTPFIRNDRLRRDAGDSLRLIGRRVILGQRVVLDKNLLYFV